MTNRFSVPLLLGLLTLPAPAPAACQPPEGALPLLQPGTIVLLGEIHGTAEAPAAVGRLACAAAAMDLPVAVALELPENQQPLIDAFLAGEGDRDGLLAGDFWRRSYQDGRSSRAMADLIEELAALHREAHDVRVVAIDQPDPPAARDQAMARRLDALADATLRGVVIALTGNLHNRLVRGNPFDPRATPMGYLLRQLRPEARIHALDLTHEGGTAWICTGAAAADCGVLSLRGESRDLGVHLDLQRPEDPFTGSLHLGAIHASPPAVATRP